MILRRAALALIAISALATTPAYAASAKPTPYPSAAKKIATSKSAASTATKKAVAPKKTAAASTKSSTKKQTTPSAIKKSEAGTTKKSSTLSKGTTKKKSTLATKQTVTAKKVTHTYVYQAPTKKIAKFAAPSNWPPKGFTSVGTAYARVPTGAELVSILSTLSDASAPVKSCAVDPTKPGSVAYACAAILVGSTEKCTWWKVSSTVTAVDPSNSANRSIVGQITVLQPGAAAKTIQSIVMVSPVPLQAGISFIGIHALCGIGATSDTVPSTTFVPDPSYTPVPSPSPTPSPSNS